MTQLLGKALMLAPFAAVVGYAIYRAARYRDWTGVIALGFVAVCAACVMGGAVLVWGRV